MTGILRSKIERLKTIGEQLISQGLKRIDRYDVVSEHSISAVFREALVKARKIDKPFGMLMLW